MVSYRCPVQFYVNVIVSKVCFIEITLAGIYHVEYMGLAYNLTKCLKKIKLNIKCHKYVKKRFQN